MVTATGFDLELAAARGLGRQLRHLGSRQTSEHVQAILERELADGIESKLVREISNSLVPADERRALALLGEVKAGFHY